ncbi:unannotated protein [freshwater metagenome]|uniref:Unannotated protein n=1 Tax=freshwater metagenome TaxID=449393 RepID=A0A6J6JKZ2_9ZZZZ|nr:glycosyltransferase [Actinomycetota bacterium]MSZ14020.1 glycosyltransferase [Actinomycetota bacterium]MTA18967.1 glycosyltransferase [Actinomycetota bacterium]MTA87819.1 glycosyltransferase [Actinomycetota bacterium]
MAPVVDKADLPVRLVVLNHNGGDLTLRSLRHLSALDWPSDQLQIVCLDNDSSDGSVERVEKELPQVEVRRLGSNLGFPANNEALKDLAGVRYVGLVNNDAFVEPGWLRELVDALDEDRGVGAACPKILLEPRFATVSITSPAFESGRIDTRSRGVILRGVVVNGVDVSSSAHLGETGWGREVDRVGPFEWARPEAVLRVPAPESSDSFSALLSIEVPADCTIVINGGSGDEQHHLAKGLHRINVSITTPLRDVINNVGSIVFDDGYGADRGWLEFDDGQFDPPVDVFAWCGGGVLFRTDYLIDVGLFDPSFFLYYEDTDLSWRGRSRGWRYRTVPSARMRHVHAASTGEVSELTSFLTERNRLLMLVRNAPARRVLSQLLRFPLITASYARRDVVYPVTLRQRPHTKTVTRRVRSFVGLLRMLPDALRQRRQLRDRQIVPDNEIEGWFVSHE